MWGPRSVQPNNFWITSLSLARERFQICLDAIKKGIIRDGAPLSDIKEVFGEPWKEEDTPDNRHYGAPFKTGKEVGMKEPYD
jgi:hypothetical protein